jgi:uncharacterized membrane protein
MNWNPSTPIPDRIFSALAYLLPLTTGLEFATFLFQQFPILQWLALPVIPIVMLYQAVPFGSLILFIVLLFLVVRNERISRFIRFNVMQAIVLDIALVILNLVLSLLNPLMGVSQGFFFVETLTNTIFLGVLVAVGYGIYESVLGQYADKIPAISDTTNMQVR